MDAVIPTICRQLWFNPFRAIYFLCSILSINGQGHAKAFIIIDYYYDYVSSSTLIYYPRLHENLL